MQWTVTATIVSTSARTTILVCADQRDVTLSAEGGETYALAPSEVRQLRAALGYGEAMRSER